MRTRRNLAENHFITTNKQLNAKNAISAKRISHFTGDFLSSLLGRGIHRLRLPGITVITIYLNMPNWFAERSAGNRTHCKQCDFIIKFYKTFHYDTSCSSAASFLGDLPRFFNIFCCFNYTLTMTA